MRDRTCRRRDREKMSLFVKLRSFSTVQQISFIRNTKYVYIQNHLLALVIIIIFERTFENNSHFISFFLRQRNRKTIHGAFGEFSAIIYQNVENMDTGTCCSVHSSIRRTDAKTGETKIISNKICLCCSYCDAKIVIPTVNVECSFSLFLNYRFVLRLTVFRKFLVNFPYKIISSIDCHYL